MGVCLFLVWPFRSNKLETVMSRTMAYMESCSSYLQHVSEIAACVQLLIASNHHTVLTDFAATVSDFCTIK